MINLTLLKSGSLFPAFFSYPKDATALLREFINIPIAIHLHSKSVRKLNLLKLFLKLETRRKADYGYNQ